MKIVADLARRIWNHHFVPLIGQEQVDYMLEKFQSASAISAQLRNGYQYYLLGLGSEWAGYLALLPDDTTGKMMISKIYIRADRRGEGNGGFLLDFANRESKRRNLNAFWLTVNRHNHGAITWYKNRGFRIIESQKQDIGGGFFMDDFVMEKTC